MKKRRLKKWVKVILTIIILGISLLMYLEARRIGCIAQTNTFYEGLAIIIWSWILLGQPVSIMAIWGCFDYSKGANNEIFN